MVLHSIAFCLLLSTNWGQLTVGDNALSPLGNAIREKNDRRARASSHFVFEDLAPTSPMTHRDALVLRAAYTDDSHFFDDVVSHLESENVTLRLGCLRVLALLNVPDCPQRVMDTVSDIAKEDSDPECQAYAISILGKRQEQCYAAILCGMLGDDDLVTHSPATQALLGCMDHFSKGSIETLIRLLHDERQYSHAITLDVFEQRPVSCDAAKLLGRIGPRAHGALPKLRDLYDSTASVDDRREYAVAVLKIDPNQKWAARFLVDTLHFHRSYMVRMNVARDIAGIEGPNFSCIPHL